MNVDATDGEAVRIAGPGFEYVYDRAAGAFVSLRREGTDLLADGAGTDSDGGSPAIPGPRVNLWRTPIANERVAWGTAEERQWRAAGLDRLAHGVETVGVERVADGVVRIRAGGTIGAPGADPAADVSYLYHVLGTGDLLVGVRVVPSAALAEQVTSWLPRVGLRMAVRPSLDRFRWYGRGPHETYPDRKTGARVGVYERPVEELHVPYVRPQASGNRTDVRWAALTDGEGRGLAAFGHPTLNVAATAATNRDRALYDHQLRSGPVTLDLDHAVTGVGGTPQPVAPAHRVTPDRPYEFVVGLRPVAPGESPAALARRRLPYAVATLDTVGQPAVEGTADGVRVRVPVRNPGSTPRTERVPLRIDGAVVARRTVDLRPGEARTVTFERATDEPVDVAVGEHDAERVVPGPEREERG